MTDKIEQLRDELEAIAIQAGVNKGVTVPDHVRMTEIGQLLLKERRARTLYAVEVDHEDYVHPEPPTTLEDAKDMYGGLGIRALHPYDLISRRFSGQRIEGQALRELLEGDS
ncbi:hypothetical protein GTQ99_00450 [Kineococcus sp. T13]|uniref:hypothetical protein n=1 Tax=Kineococcus vitellinus TaxID=2696565 RepID=UPI00141250C4|nr:hypothetical protein [Kineococcus vitellinus]NAZ73901.1 hypothetical protein [Kineococcus vitellinus]